jgi:hypothetical protein
MTTSSDNQFDLTDLQWQAFCYVAGEMSPADSEQFEQLLSGDLAACEAVVYVTELSLSARTVFESQSTPLIRSLPSQPARAGRWVATIAAFAALALLFAIVSMPKHSGSTPDPVISSADRQQERSRSEQILSHWMTPVSNNPEDSVDEFEPFAEETVLVSYELEGEVAQIPDWMFDAVLLEPHTSGQEIRDESGSPVQEK